ncbi:hypothetical protein ACIQUM_07920 [Amycolatopsis azurea]|uniref:hypothetical protein n=1 Tax=Amycolatopsis azurea TaxID=36819 RepID=UPI00381E09DA
MTNQSHKVTDEQIAAARLRQLLDEKQGRPTPDIVNKIAGAVPGDEITGLKPDTSSEASSRADQFNVVAVKDPDPGMTINDLYAFIEKYSRGAWLQSLAGQSKRKSDFALTDPATVEAEIKNFLSDVLPPAQEPALRAGRDQLQKILVENIKSSRESPGSDVS